MAVFAHPDDVELCIGGTMLKLRARGYRTGILDVTRGEMGTRGTPEIRAQEAAKAAEILGVTVRENLELPDGHVWLNEDSRVKLARALRRLKPKVILTQQIDDPHPDHDRIARLVREAARLSSMQKYDAESGQQRIAVPMVAHNVFSRLVAPSFIVDVSEHVEEKMKAINAYASQFHDPNSTEPETRLSSKHFLGEIEARMRYYGSLIGTAAGEPFYAREALNVDDPVALLTRPMNLYS